MRGPTIKRPSGPRQDHRQHLRLANYTSFTPQWESHWVMAWQRCICSHLLHVDKMNQVVDTQEHFVPLKACQQMSSLCLFASLLEHCQCFPCEDVCLIFALESASRNTVPRAIFPNTLPRGQGVYWIIWSLEIISFGIAPLLAGNTKKYIPTVRAMIIEYWRC